MATKKKPYVIVRTVNAGVHAGELVLRKGGEVTLSNARRLWYWKCARGFTLNSVAVGGLASESKTSEPVPSILLLGAIELIPCSKAAEKSIRQIRSHKP